MIKILFLSANPQDPALGRTLLEKEIRAIQQELRATRYRNALEIVSAWAVQPKDWLHELNEHMPHVIHFSGHGTQSGEILCEGADGSPQAVSPETLARIFRACKDNIRLVVLNACYSRVQAEAIVREIDCVVGMNGVISNRTAIAFTCAFYSALGFGRSVQQAYNQGLAAIDIGKTAIPELIPRSGIDPSTVHLLSPTATPSSSTPGSQSGPVPKQADDGEQEAISIFYCYAPEDQRFSEALEKHFVGMRRQGLIRSWHPQDVRAGSLEREKEQQALDEAGIILVLVSPSLLDSDTHYAQIEQALVRRERDQIPVIPIIVRATEGWQETTFGKVISLPRNRPPIAEWQHRDTAFAAIAREIRQIVNDECKKRQYTPNAPATITQTISVEHQGEIDGADQLAHGNPIQQNIRANNGRIKNARQEG